LSDNTLVTWSSSGLVTELSPEGEVVWQMGTDLGTVFGYLEHVTNQRLR